MQLGLIIETADPESVWNAFRLANTALEAEHDVEIFLLGDGVEAATIDAESFNPRGLVRKYAQSDGHLFACGTCLDARGLESSELRPRSTMEDLLDIIDRADNVVTIG